MAVPLKVFTSARAALEVTRGTSLVPTRLIYGEVFNPTHTVATIRPEERRASYEGFYSAAAGPEAYSLDITGRVTYDDIIWWANLFFKGVASGTGAGADKLWAFTPTNTTDDVKTATMQLGDINAISTGSPGIQVSYCFGDTLNIHYEKNNDGAVTFNGKLMTAKPVTQITAFTGALSDRTVVFASANNTVVKIDATTIGTTTDSAVTVVDFTINLHPQPFMALDGTTTAAAIYRPGVRTWQAQITRQYNSSTGISAFQNKTIQKVRVLTTGPVLGATNYIIQQDMYGVYTARDWAEVNGIVTEVLMLEPVFDTTTSTSTSLTVTNATSAIT